MLCIIHGSCGIPLNVKFSTVPAGKGSRSRGGVVSRKTLENIEECCAVRLVGH